MVTSQHRTYGFWFPVVLATFFVFSIVSAVTEYQFDCKILPFELFFSKEYQIIGMAIFFLLLSCSYLYFRIKNIRINKDNKIISFQNIFTRKITNYNFTDFDGYIDTFIVHSKSNNWTKTIGLVQGKRVVRRIDSYYISNFNQLREAFTNCNYLGEVKFCNWDCFRMTLNYEVLE